MLRLVALTCVIVDDNPFVQRAVRELLEREGVEFVGVCATAAEAVALVAAFQPNVTLVDIDLGGESGFDPVARLQPAPTVLACDGLTDRVIAGHLFISAHRRVPPALGVPQARHQLAPVGGGARGRPEVEAEPSNGWRREAGL
jgi:CheY-like chemotaxis protein